jgi:hypothetical protein
MGQVTGKEQFCALVDASDSFDPESADAMGVCLSRLLWVRCIERGMKAVEQAFKAADILVHSRIDTRLTLGISHLNSSCRLTIFGSTIRSTPN